MYSYTIAQRRNTANDRFTARPKGATQMFQDKAQTAKNGLVLLKGCNTVLGHLGSSEPINLGLTEH